MKAQKEKLESLGYDCAMVFVDTTLEVSKQRNAARARKLPDDIIEDMWGVSTKGRGILKTSI